MKNKKILVISIDILIYCYLFYLFNPLFAEKGQWFSWQGTLLVLVIIIISIIIEVSGIWGKIGNFLQKKMKI